MHLLQIYVLPLVLMLTSNAPVWSCAFLPSKLSTILYSKVMILVPSLRDLGLSLETIINSCSVEHGSKHKVLLNAGSLLRARLHPNNLATETNWSL